MPRGRPASPPHVELRELEGRAPTYYIFWHDGEKQRKRSTGTGSRAEADRIFARWLLDYEEDRRRSGADDRPRYTHEITIADILARYADEKGPNMVPSGRARIGYAITRLADWWVDRCCDAIKPITCNNYRDARLKDGVGLATVRKELAVLSAALSWAKDNGRLVEVPTVTLPPKAEPRDRWLTVSEAARLVNAARTEPKARLHLAPFVLIGLYTGARTAAILDLQWTQVDFVHNCIAFNPPGRVQNNKRRTRVRMTRGLRALLLRMHTRAASPYVLAYHGEPIKRIIKGFRAAARRAGLDDVTPHTLRHTNVTWQLDGDVPIYHIGGFVGHSDVRTTQGYAHRHLAQQDASIEALERKRNKRA